MFLVPLVVFLGVKLKAITETWISLEEENSDDDNCEGDLFEEKNDEDEDTDIESEEEIEEIFELF